jgi:putative oxidoreductase
MRKFTRLYGDYFYFVFRAMAGLLFLQHGLQKLLGMFGGTAAEFGTLFWTAGVIELLVGVTITLGILTRYAAVLGAVEMLGAYFLGHIKNGFIPIMNKGELALLFFAAFLVIIVYGHKKWGLDGLVQKE